MEDHSPPEMRTSLRNILGAFLFSGEDHDKKVSVLSGGERARLAMACMLLRPFNLLVLDEPTNHLDMISKDVLKSALLKYDGAVIVVSHDREFLGGLTDRTVEFRDHKLHEYLGDVNYFLEKRALDDMRQVEMATVVETTRESSAQNGELSHEERKQRMRKVSNAEKKVERLEREIKKLEVDMAKPEFYERKDYQKTMDRHVQLKKDLAAAEEAWELAVEELG